MALKKTLDLVKNEIEFFGFKLLTETYVNNKQKLQIKCKNHHLIEKSLDKFKQNPTCPFCQKTQKYTQAFKHDFLKKIGYKFCSNETIKYKQKQTFICDKNHYFVTSFEMLFSRGHKCNLCNKYKPKNYLKVKEIIESSSNYKLVSDKYINAHEKIKIQCNHGHIYESSLSNFQAGKRCPNCWLQKKESKGSQKIKNFLIQNNIDFQIEKKFENCKNIRDLKFDFYLPLNNILIEFQGIQHYELKRQFDVKNKKNAFENQVKRDNIKRKFCLEQQIHLVEIAFWDIDKIEIILKNLLNLK